MIEVKPSCPDKNIFSWADSICKANIFKIAILVLLSFAGCIKEKSTVSNTIFTNSTSHAIAVNAYAGGQIQSASSFSLSANETKQVFSIRNGGIGIGCSFGYYNFPVDSFLVFFDSSYSIAHYKFTLIGNKPKRYLYSSKRNIYNDSSYVAHLVYDAKFKREWDLNYTFIEQDYLDAR